MAVGARGLEDAQTFANNFKIPKAYGSYDELAKDPDVGKYSPKEFCSVPFNCSSY